jgi:hypothetical protein
MDDLQAGQVRHLRRWNYKTHSYDSYEVPISWDIPLIVDDMSQKVNCAGCGVEIPFGETFTSFEIHSLLGLGYCVCSKCHAKELQKKNLPPDDTP